MKPKSLLSSLFISSIVTLILFSSISSCKKIRDIEFKPQDDNLVEKFFNAPEETNEALKNVIADIKKQEDKNHFVSQLVPEYGMPAWNWFISNTSVRNVNARSTTGDSLQLFLVPFRAADSSVSSYLMCAKNGDEFTYRYYKKNTIAQLYAANDTIKRLREGLLSIFSFFEKGINNRDSISIGGIYNETVNDVIIKINDVPVSYASRSTLIGLSILEVCYTVSGGGPQQRSASLPAERCIQVGVYGSLADLGFTTDNGYTSGSGGGGGGSTGGGSGFPDGFQCPQTEWWCESGDYTFVNGVLYTPESYPGMYNGFPWLWWENPDYDFIVPADGPNLDLTDYLKCYTNDPSFTYKITVAVDQPVPGSRTTYTKGNGGSSASSSKKDVDAGHTFLILEQVYPNGITVRRNVGFYPAGGVNPFSPNANGLFKNDEGHNYDVSITTTVTGTQFMQLLDIIKNSQNEGYNLNSNNCSSYCTEKLSQIGINLPETIGNWPGGSGVNPGDLGEDIRGMQLQQNQTRNTNGGQAPANNVTC